jgi:hypothetical protein
MNSPIALIKLIKVVINWSARSVSIIVASDMIVLDKN